jgi:chemotaxis protein histidine kinase CheA
LPVAPALLAFGLATFLKPAVDENQAAATTSAVAQQKQIKKSGEVLRKKLEERRQEAREKGLKDAEELFGKLEQGTRELGKTEQPDRKQALVKLNDLAKDLEKRRQALGNNQRLKEQLQQQLKQLQQGPAEKLAEALRQGDFAQAAKELEKLRQELAKGEMNAQEREQFAKQLDQLQQKLAEMAGTQRQMADELNKQVAEKQAAGDQAGAQRLQQQLDKLAQQMNDHSLEQMALKLGKSAKALQQGDAEQVAAQLKALEAEMGKLAEQQAESEMIREALDEIASAKDGMNCKECDGAGCKACQGGDSHGGMKGDGSKKGGHEAGHGRGDGVEPEEKTDTSLYDTRVRQKVGRGTGVMTGLAPGPNTKGRVGEEIKHQWQEVRGDAADPLADQQLPRGYRDHAKTYFDALREGQKQ